MTKKPPRSSYKTSLNRMKRADLINLVQQRDSELLRQSEKEHTLYDNMKDQRDVEIGKKNKLYEEKRVLSQQLDDERAAHATTQATETKYYKRLVKTDMAIANMVVDHFGQAREGQFDPT